MEDTKSLLMMVLHKIFQNQPKTIENTFQLIHSFNNGKTENKNYEKTLKAICDLMNDKLPSPILVYILTLVDMPQDFNSQSPVVEKMRKTHDYFPEINVRPHLLEYLNNIKPSCNVKNRRNSGEANILGKRENLSVFTTNEDKLFSSQSRSSYLAKQTKLMKRTKRIFSRTTRSPKHLLDICAVSVVTNEKYLKIMYKNKQTLAWNLLNANMLYGDQLKQCYDVVKDLNKKVKWLRDIESENISSTLLLEEYGNSDIFLKENYIHNQLEKNLELPTTFEKIIKELVEKE